MTRISPFFVASTTLAALALSVGSAGATKVEIHTPTPQVIVHPPKVTVKTPTIQSKGQKTISWKPKAVKTQSK